MIQLPFESLTLAQMKIAELNKKAIELAGRIFELKNSTVAGRSFDVERLRLNKERIGIEDDIKIIEVWMEDERRRQRVEEENWVVQRIAREEELLHAKQELERRARERGLT